MASRLTAVAALALVACGSATEVATQSAPATGVRVVFDEGNPGCATGLASFQIDPPVSGTYVNPADGAVFQLVSDGTTVTWSADLSMDEVIAKGGPNANLYLYDPESNGGAGLAAPLAPGSGAPYGLTHVTFCYDYELDVTASVEPSFTRTLSWAIAKSSPVSSLTLAAGAVAEVPFRVAVTTTGARDWGWSIAGTIVLRNPAPFPATVQAVTDAAGGVALPVSCPAPPPFLVPPFGTVTCTFASTLPDGAPRLDEATVSTTGPVGGGAATAPVAFERPTSLVDACVPVTDDRAGPLGAACAPDGAVFEYTAPVSYPVCGPQRYVNVASFRAMATEASAASAWTVSVDVTCTAGCTLTQGYWKTHSSYGPAPADPAWAAVGGPDAPFFRSGRSWYESLWTEPGGSAYWVLAHAYAAARLNALGGASTPADVAAALAASEALLGALAPDAFADAAIRSEALALAALLDAYDNGAVGPGHCE